MKKTLLSTITSLFVLVAFSFLVFLIFSRPAGLAQVETGAPPPAFEAAAVTYEVTRPDYDWIDISGAYDEQIVAADFEDNLGSRAFELGFYFPFFDNVYAELRYSDNGYVYFGGDETTGANTPQRLPSSVDGVHNLIAPLGADLFRNPGDSTVYLARQESPERRFVIQFEHAYWCCSLENPLDFQIVLYPDGRILTQYRSIRGTAQNYVSAGLENADGSHGQAVYSGFLGQTDQLGDETAFLYDPGDSILGRLRFIPDRVETTGPAGQIVTLSADLLNLSGVETDFSLSHTLQLNAEAGDTAWQVETVTEPGSLGNGEFGPLTVAVAIPATAAAGDTATFVFTAAPAAREDLAATVTFMVEVRE